MYFTTSRGRPWRYSVIPSTPDFPTEYQIRWHSNPAGLPTFAAIWGPDFRASIIRLTCPHVFKQINKNRITLMTMFKVNRGLLPSKVDNCNEGGSQLPHRAHISRASCLKNPAEPNDISVFKRSVFKMCGHTLGEPL